MAVIIDRDLCNRLGLKRGSAVTLEVREVDGKETLTVTPTRGRRGMVPRGTVQRVNG